MKLPTYLYFSISLLWLYSGIQPIATAPKASMAMLAQLGIAQTYQYPVLVFASVLDVIFGVLIFSRIRHQPWFWLLQFVTVASYSLIVGIFLPENWLHPFAPLVKNLPIMGLLFFVYQQALFNRKFQLKQK